MYEGKNDDKLQVVEYELEDLYQVLKDAVEYAFKKVDVRFNFFISPKQLAFLNRIAKDKGIPRSAYIRNLLDVEMMREGK
jgi:predicted DNA binding CopG/RHH family protein